MPDTISQTDGFGYADDNKALFSPESEFDRAVDALGTWLKEIKMSLNINKTNINKNLKDKMTASLNNQCLPITRSEKDVKLIVNDIRNWTENCSKICSKRLSAFFKTKES